MSDAAPASAALSAFLRGVERRGAVFAHLQAGDAEAGMAALATAMASFRGTAVRTAFGDWPRRFWSLLLATPALRDPAPGGRWPAGFEALGRIGRGPRAALLLRLIAHVSEADAAAVLGVSRPTYRLALRRALPRTPEGGPDQVAWRMLGEAAQHAVREMSPEQLAELARVREAALQGAEWKPAAPVAPTPGDEAAGERARWLWPVLAVVAAATVGAIALLEWRHPAEPGRNAGPETIQSEALSPPPAPASSWDDDLALLTHPDFELLAAAAQGTAMADPAFNAWLAHRFETDQGEAPPPESGAGAPATAPERGRVLPPALQELTASLPAPERARLASRHVAMEAMTADGLDALRAEAARWERLDLDEQRDRRDAWQAWNRLPADVRMRMRVAEAAWAGLLEEQREELAAEFAALDELERNGWLLGPDVGADWPQLHPLFALVPAEQQDELLAVLLSMDALERADLGVLAQRTPPGERDALRAELLTTPPENRGAWLRQRAGQ